jgi:hypothetical protein
MISIFSSSFGIKRIHKITQIELIRIEITVGERRLANDYYLSKMKIMLKTSLIPGILLSLYLLLAGCARDELAARVTLPLPTLTLQATLVPSLERNFQALNTLQLTPTPDETQSQCRNDQNPLTPHYTIEGSISYGQRTVSVQQNIAYINHTLHPLPSIILNVKPNAQDGIFSLKAVSINQVSVDQDAYVLSGQRLRIPFIPNLAPGCMAHIDLAFQLALPPIDDTGLRAFQGYFGYSLKQINLGHWLPVVAVYDGSDWINHDPSVIGEQDVLESANWDITVMISDAPDDVRLAAPGTVIEEDSRHGKYILSNARDFSLSLGSGYQIREKQTESGVTVELYSFDDALIQTEAGAIDSAAFSLDVAAKSLATFERLYGEYPYERLVIVQGDFPDGMEFSGLAFVSGDFFRRFAGATSFLTLITAHEVAHQWWYNRVGNDQALNPWLDEALATYSEYVFIEAYFPDLKDWWWEFRVDRLSPVGFVDSSIYEFASRRAYIDAVYLRGVRMLHELRLILGDEAFYDWLRRYAQAGSNRVMTPEQFWGLLTPEQYRATAAIRERYLQNPQIIRISSGAP